MKRSEQAAERLTALAEDAEPDARLGTKDELRALCSVSVGTFNEALRLAQARGVVRVRSGPGGGVFATRQSPMVRLGNSVLALDDDAATVADAVRLRDALDPLLVEDALRHAACEDVTAMRCELERMRTAAQAMDSTGFVHANWALHGRIAAVSPNTMLRSFYTSLLGIIESHVLSVLPVDEQPLPDYVWSRYELHAALVDAIAARDTAAALRLVSEHSTTTRPAVIPAEARLTSSAPEQPVPAAWA